MTIAIADAKICGNHLDLDCAGGSYVLGDRAWPSMAAVPGVTLLSGGGVALLPDGSLRNFAAGTPRQAAGVGLLLEPASSNLLSQYNTKPSSISGWGLLSNRPDGATLTIVNDNAALYAATDPSGGGYIFRALIDAGVMNGMVLQAYNPSATEDFIVPCFNRPAGETHAFSAYVRCVAGSGYLTITGGGGSTPDFSGAGWRRVGRVHPATAGAGQVRLVVRPESTVLVILACLEPGGQITSPIVVQGRKAARAADRFDLVAPGFLSRPHVAVVDATIGAADFVDRRLLTIADDRALREITVTRLGQNNRLATTMTGAVMTPYLPRVQGAGRLLATLRVQARERSMGFGGALAHDPFSLPPKRLQRIVLGSAQDGSAALTGWIRRLLVTPERDDEQLRAMSVPPAGSVAIDIFRYIDPAGSDANDGLSPASAWRTLGKIATGDVPGGAHVLLKRGGSWSETLLPLASCTFGAYGAGARPRIGIGQQFGVDENGASYFRLEDLHVTQCTQRPFNQNGFGGTQIARCEFSYSGGTDPSALAIAFRNGSNFMVRLSYIHHCRGDGIFVQFAGGAKIIEGNVIETPTGNNDADNIQMSRDDPGSRQVVRFNWVSMRTLPGVISGKGGMVLEGPCECTDNRVIGMNFCIGFSFDDIYCARNHVSDADLNDYSWGIAVSNDTDSHRVTFEDNIVERVNRGLAITGQGGSPTTGPKRIDHVIRRNIVEDCPAALFVNRPVSGRFTNNLIQNCDEPFDLPATITVATGGRYTDFRLIGNRVEAD